MNVLELRGVVKTYRRGGFFRKGETFFVLRDVDIEIESGECVGLAGRSGSGKSTLGRIILGLESPDAGQGRLLGQDMFGADKTGVFWDKTLRQSVQVVFQDALGSVNPRFRAGEIIAEPLRNFENMRGPALQDRVKELLERVGLRPGDAFKHPCRFSGGQLQRVCIARALAVRPRLIVLDEAVSSLDMLAQSRILDLLDDLRREDGTSYLFITHDLRLVRRFCDRALAMSEGRLEPYDHTGYGALPPCVSPLFEAMLPSRPRNPLTAAQCDAGA